MKAFIFDMDGVIIDSEPMHFAMDIETLAHLGIEVEHRELERFVGMTNPEMWAILKEERGFPQSVEEVIEYQLAAKFAYMRSQPFAPIAGIPELIAELQRRSIKLAVASSSPIRLIDEVLRLFGLRDRFERVVSGEEVPRGKPEPDVYLEAARQLGVEPGDCVVLEDSRNGVRAAKAAGMRCIGFANVNSGQQDLSQADLIVGSVGAISVASLLHYADDAKTEEEAGEAR